MVTLSGCGLSISTVEDVSLRGLTVTLDPDALRRVAVAHERVQEWGRLGRPMYGVNTGFGEMVHVAIPARHAADLQGNLLRGHAAGAGPVFDESVVRAILLSRLNCLLQGYSGVGVAVVELLAAFLNLRIHPVIPQQGSLGASGDLAPLSHMAIALCGWGDVLLDGEAMGAQAALERHGLGPVTLGFKEGLALINGTSAMTGLASLAVLRAYGLLELATFLSAVYVECLRGATRAFEPRGHELKGHAGQRRVAGALAGLLRGSGLTVDHGDLMDAVVEGRGGDDGVQSTGVFIQQAYTLRCVPQILGPVLDTLAFVANIVETELNSANDNPLVFETAEESFHGGNFHGQYVAMACDYLAIALTEVGVLAERQLNRIVDPHLNGGLPDFLALRDSGLECGLMGAQYLATSIASENLDLAAPSSVKSIPTNGSNQDVVSMGLNAARRCSQLCDNIGRILGVLGAACYQAASIIGSERFSPAGREWYRRLSDRTPPYDDSTPVNEFLGVVREELLGGDTAALVHKSVAFRPGEAMPVVQEG